MTADCQQMHLILPIVLHMYIWSMCPIPPRVSSVPGTLYTVLIVRLYGVITLLVPLIGAWHSTPSQTILPEYILEQCQIPLPKTGQASFQAVTRPASLFFFFLIFFLFLLEVWVVHLLHPDHAAVRPRHTNVWGLHVLEEGGDSTRNSLLVGWS